MWISELTELSTCYQLLINGLNIDYFHCSARLIYEMMMLSIGILIGLVLSVLVLVATAHFRPAIDRTISQVISITKQKGEVIEPEDEDLENWKDSLPQE